MNSKLHREYMFGVTSLFYCLKIHPFEYALSNEKDLYIINALYLLRGLYEEMPSRAFCRGTSFLSINFYSFPEEFFGYCYALDSFSYL